MPRTGPELLLRFPLNAQSLETQERIADFLDRETQRIDGALEAIDAIEALAGSRLESAISEALESWPKTVPLKRLVDSRRPLTYGIVQAGEDCPGGVPYIRPTDMFGHSGVPDAEMLLRTSPEIAHSYRRSILEPGDLVVSIGPSFGKTMLVPSELEGANLTQGTARVAPADGNSARFLRWVLRGRAARAHWEVSVGGATFRALNLEPLGLTPVPLVPLKNQLQIADRLDAAESAFMESGDKLRQLKSLLLERRHSLISAAVTGQLDVEAMV